MLLGASLQPLQPQNQRVRIVLSGYSLRWPAMVWAQLLLEMTETRLFRARVIMRPQGGSPKLLLQTQVSRLLYPHYRRWYPPAAGDTGRRAVTPPDLQLDVPRLAFWLVGALTATRGEGPVVLRAPGLTPVTAARLGGQITALTSWPCQTCPEGRVGVITILQAARPEVERWLTRYVPRAVWARTKPERSVRPVSP